MKSTISWLDLVSQMPSQPMMMKSSSPVRSNSRTSGLAVTGCSSGVSSLFYLYFKSPRDLLRFRLPSTLPSTIWLPAFSILRFSSSLSGLWSYERGIALPPRAITHLESPALATYNFFISSIKMQFAVQPIESSIKLSLLTSEAVFEMSPSSLNRGALLGGFYLFIVAISSLPGSFSNCLSISKKLYLRLSLKSSSLNFSLSLMVCSKCAFVYIATSRPPCPSNTPNRARFLDPFTKFRFVMCASSYT